MFTRAVSLLSMSFGHDALMPVLPGFDYFEEYDREADDDAHGSAGNLRADDLVRLGEFNCKRLPAQHVSVLPPITPLRSLFPDPREVVDIINLSRFQVRAQIGSGGTSRVFWAVDTTDNSSRALKVIRKRDVFDQTNGYHHLARELRISQMDIGCPFVMNEAVVCEGPYHHFMISRLLTGGELRDLICKRGHLSEPETRFYVAELVCALDALHRVGILYRDMKPDNILLDADGHVGLVDFGLSKPDFWHNSRAKGACGTLKYLAPELIVGDSYGRPADIWSLGCVMFEMLAGRAPFFDPESRRHQNESIVFAQPDYPCWLSPMCVTLMEGMLVKKQERRFDLAAIMAHPWFTGVDWEEARRGCMAPLFIPDPLQVTSNYQERVRREILEEQRSVERAKLFTQTP